MKKQFVVRSINNSDQSQCVDIFKRKDNTYGFRNIEETKKLMKAGIKFIFMDIMSTYLNKKL